MPTPENTVRLAAPLIAELGKTLPPCDIQVSARAWVAVQLYGERGAWYGAQVVTDHAFIA